MNKYHTVVIGGGCLGSATAISLAKHLKSINQNPESICLIEKNLLNSALSLKHSGIVRAANADLNAAHLAKVSTEMWLNIKELWGTECEVHKNGAIWIAKKNENETNAKWDKLAADLKSIPINFKKITLDQAHKLCPDFVALNEDEVFYHEPDCIFWGIVNTHSART